MDFDWVKALDALGRGHNLPAANQVREFMAAIGVEGLPLAPAEVEEIKRLRDSADRNQSAALAIERRAEAVEMNRVTRW